MNTRHVGWDATRWGQNYTKAYYDPSVIAWISEAVTRRTMGLDTRPIQVTSNVIENVLDSYLTNFRSFPGDIHTRYNIPGDGNFSGDFGLSNSNLSSNYVINQVVEFMVEYIKSEYQIIANNGRFSVWSSLYGANDFGLRAHPEIKLREKRPSPFQFHMKF